MADAAASEAQPVVDAAAPDAPCSMFCAGTDLCLYDTRIFSGGLVPGGEEGRVAALNSLEMLDTPRESLFDNITELLKRTFDTAG